MTSVLRDQPHFAPPTPGLHCIHFLKPQYHSTPPPSSQHTPEQFMVCAGAIFMSQHCMSFQSALLWRSSVQLHNGALRCRRKIRVKATVQQSSSRQTRNKPSLMMHNVALHEKRKVSEKQPKPTAAHHSITTARHPDHTRSSAMVRSQSTWSMTGSCCRPRRRPPKTSYVSAIFARCTCMCTYIQPHHKNACQNVYVNTVYKKIRLYCIV